MLEYKYGTIYRQVMNAKRLNFCEMMTSKSAIGKVYQQMIHIVRDSYPSAVHNCPYRELIISNATLNMHSAMSIFPSGDYKFIGIISNEKDPNIVTVTIYGSNVSPDKETFG